MVIFTGRLFIALYYIANETKTVRRHFNVFFVSLLFISTHPRYVRARGLAVELRTHNLRISLRIVGSSPVAGVRVVPLSKALYLDYSSQPRCINGYRYYSMLGR